MAIVTLLCGYLSEPFNYLFSSAKTSLNIP